MKKIFVSLSAKNYNRYKVGVRVIGQSSHAWCFGTVTKAAGDKVTVLFDDNKVKEFFTPSDLCYPTKKLPSKMTGIVQPYDLEKTLKKYCPFYKTKVKPKK